MVTNWGQVRRNEESRWKETRKSGRCTKDAVVSNSWVISVDSNIVDV
jgi:hypothetical protein